MIPGISPETPTRVKSQYMSPAISTALPLLTFLSSRKESEPLSLPLRGPLLFYLPRSLPMAPSLLLNHHSCSCLKPSPSSSPGSYFIVLHLLKVTVWLQVAMEYTSLGSWPHLNSRTTEHQASFLPDTATWMFPGYFTLNTSQTLTHLFMAFLGGSLVLSTVLT